MFPPIIRLNTWLAPLRWRSVSAVHVCLYRRLAANHDDSSLSNCKRMGNEGVEGRRESFLCQLLGLLCMFFPA